MKKVEKEFTVQIEPLAFDNQKERLYHAHKHRFQGFLYDSFKSMILGLEVENVFDSFCVCVYDKEKLIAFSVFDAGKTSNASISGIFDEAYSNYSLGKYTLLKEVQHAMSNNRLFVYPGYITHGCSDFDYKILSSGVEYLNSKKKWGPFEALQSADFPAEKINQLMQNLHKKVKPIYPEARLMGNPYFSIHYIPEYQNKVPAGPLGIWIPNKSLWIEYILETRSYRIGTVKTNARLQSEIDMDMEKDFYKPEEFFVHPMEFELSFTCKSQSVLFNLLKP